MEIQELETNQGRLATRLREALERQAISAFTIAERTRVPQTTVEALLGEEVNAVLPPRVYLRGHAALVADELGIAKREVLDLFDQAYPARIDDEEIEAAPHIPVRVMAVGAAMSGIGILAVILAFAS